MTLLELLPNLFVIINFSVGTYGVIDQIVLNAKISSTRGLSLAATHFAMILLFLNLYFTLARGLPAVYLYVHSFSFVLRAVILGQYAWYTKRRKTLVFLRVSATVLVFAMASFFLWMLSAHALFIGDIVGWLLAVSSFVIMGPQIIHNWHRGSVEGFSKPYLFTGVFCTALNGATALLFHLPLQSLVQALIGITLKSIELMQNIYYWNKRKTE